MNTDEPEPERSSAPRRALVALLVGVFLLCYVPFLDKAFHVDDHAYLHLSTLYGWNPLDVERSDYPYLGRPLEGMLPYESTHPFLVPYLIKVGRALVGGSERALHGFFTLFALLAAWGFASLLGSLGRVPRGARFAPLLFFTTTPGFLLSSHSVMTDVPMLAFLLAGAALYVRGIETRSGAALVLAGVAQLAALSCAYQSALLLVLVFGYALLRRRLDLRVFAALAAPALLFAGWIALVYVEHGVFLFKSDRPDSGFSAKEEIERALGGGGGATLAMLRKLLHAVAIWGSAALFLLPLRALALDRLRSLAWTWAVSALLGGLAVRALLAAQGELVHVQWDDLLLAGLLTGAGIVAFATALRTTWQDRGPETLFALAWFVGFALFAIVLLPFGSARYQLPSLVALVLLLVRDVPWPRVIEQRRLALTCALGGSLVLGLACARVDRLHADSYREAARHIATICDERDDVGEAWFIGEWGFRHYMLEEGAHYLLLESQEPRTGDLIVLSDMHDRFWYPPGAYSERVEELERITPSDPLPLRVFDSSSPAGFYSSGYGLLPFAASRAALEVFHLYHIVRDAPGK